MVGASIDRYIALKLYWVLHAPRQSGKTTFLQSWMKKINGQGHALACYVSVERCQQLPRSEDAIPAVCSAIREYARLFLGENFVPDLPQTDTASLLSSLLINWAVLTAPKPLVVLFDEVDVLEDQAMISFLRQLRGGFAARGVGRFPVSIALVGLRDLRDYLVRSKEGVPLNPASPFNIKEDSATLSNFTIEDIRTLAGMHTAETGQPFSDEALELVWDFTRGQPWLVNALLKKCTWTLCPEGEPVETEHIRQARELLIEERAVHLDSLAERLKEPRIKRIVEVIMTGEMDPTLTEGDDFRLALDLGLVTMENGNPAIANPIYRETIARILSQGMQAAIPEPEFAWKKPDGSLDMDALLKGFQEFWSWHSDIWEARADYTEAFPHLLLMAFLQRIVNGGGRVEREYAAGRGRMDLAVWYAQQWYIIEIKLVNRRGREGTIQEGLRQISRYRDTVDPKASAYLVVFDRTPEGRSSPWESRLYWEKRGHESKTITLIGG